jgi:rhamnosyltransferase
LEQSRDYPQADAMTGRGVCAVVVTYHPDAGLMDRLCSIARQVERVFLVDNGSGPQLVQMLREHEERLRLSLILNEANLGVAAALNQGLSAAIKAGFHWALTLDQDSVAAESMVAEQLSTLSRASSVHTVLSVCPNVYSAHSTDPRPWGWLVPNEKWPYLFKIRRSTFEDIEGVTLAITSGALMNLLAFKRLGPFREEYFIDYVDTEYCLRAKKSGFTILVSAKARLDQKLGNPKEFTVLGRLVTPTFHSPLRRYYIQRNRIPTIRSFGLIFPHWLVFDVLVNSFHHALILLFEDRKLEKLFAAALGTWHGLRGRLGPK